MNCKHELKDYVGFNDAFKYCVHCGKKESELPPVPPRNSIDDVIDEAYKQWLNQHMDTMKDGFWGSTSTGPNPATSASKIPHG
jgi:hypothetical protein